MRSQSKDEKKGSTPLLDLIGEARATALKQAVQTYKDFEVELKKTPGKWGDSGDTKLVKTAYKGYLEESNPTQKRIKAELLNAEVGVWINNRNNKNAKKAKDPKADGRLQVMMALKEVLGDFILDYTRRSEAQAARRETVKIERDKAEQAEAERLRQVAKEEAARILTQQEALRKSNIEKRIDAGNLKFSDFASLHALFKPANPTGLEEKQDSGKKKVSTSGQPDDPSKDSFNPMG